MIQLLWIHSRHTHHSFTTHQRQVYEKISAETRPRDNNLPQEQPCSWPRAPHPAGVSPLREESLLTLPAWSRHQGASRALSLSCCWRRPSPTFPPTKEHYVSPVYWAKITIRYLVQEVMIALEFHGRVIVTSHTLDGFSTAGDRTESIICLRLPVGGAAEARSCLCDATTSVLLGLRPGILHHLGT